MTERYHAVNSQWPETLPTLTGPEAISAAKRLYRMATKRKWRGSWKLTSGRRFTWPRRSVFYVNPARTGDRALETGWRDLVHMMSHWCFRELHPKRRPHDSRHEYLEREMVAYVLAQGWLEGKLRAKPSKARPKPDARQALEARAARWTTKLRRAETALRKIARQRARLARREAVPLAAG